MQFFSLKLLGVFFKLTCVITTVWSIGYWCFIYAVVDEDLCLVDYKTVESITKNEMPVLSMCFVNPFLEDKLKKINPNINSSLYLGYLKGEIFDERLVSINYNDVTFNLTDYLLYSWVVHRDGTQRNNNDIKLQINVTFSGIYLVHFVKCFGINFQKEDYKDVKIASFAFKRTHFLDPSMRSSHFPSLFFHYPNQFLLSNYPKWLSKNVTRKFTYMQEIAVTGVEILHRRNKRKEKCLENTVNYDGLALKNHIENNNCRAPYLIDNQEGSQACTNKTQIKASMYEVLNLRRKYTPPCRRMTKVDFEYEEHDVDLTQLDEYDSNVTALLNVVYPDQIKIIVQSQSVDFQVMTSNIGGVIGIYLGKIIPVQ